MSEKSEQTELSLRKTGADQPWSLADSLQMLVTAANILLYRHDYDGARHEEILYAKQAAEKYLAASRTDSASEVPNNESGGKNNRVVSYEELYNEVGCYRELMDSIEQIDLIDGFYIKRQDSAFWVFDKNGEGVCSGESRLDAFLKFKGFQPLHKIAQLRAQKDWTPISEGLPEEGVKVYWQLKDGNPYIGYRNGNLVLRRGGSSGEYLSSFTAYRPLPPAYEGEGK